jgi:hypothetical protein
MLKILFYETFYIFLRYTNKPKLNDMKNFRFFRAIAARMDKKPILIIVIIIIATSTVLGFFC